MAPLPRDAARPDPAAHDADPTAPLPPQGAEAGTGPIGVPARAVPGTVDGPTPSDAATLVLEHFAWIDGAVDTRSMLRDEAALAAIAAELTRLAAPFEPDLVMGIEARDLVLAPMVALGLGTGFSPLRAGDAMFPGPTSRGIAAPDYRGRRRELAVRIDHLAPGERVVIVDDWIETGSHVSLARDLIATTGSELVGIVVIVDETSPAIQTALPPIASIVRGEDLP